MKDEVTDLDAYVHSNDGFFRWTEIDSHRFDGVTLYIVNMTSQRWQTGK